MNELFLILGMMLVTFAVRYPVLALTSRITLPSGLLRTLRYVPPAVLAAIVLPEMFFNTQGALDINTDNAYLIAGVFSFIVAWRTKNTLITIVLGMGVLLGLKAVLNQF